MKLVTVISALVAGAAAKHLKKRDEKREAQERNANTYILGEEEANYAQPEERDENESLKWEAAPADHEESPGDVRKSQKTNATVLEASRAMDPLTLQGASRVTFECPDEQKRKFFIPGQNGAFLKVGDKGVLTFSGATFISFEKEDGEFISPLFHTVPDRRKA